MATVLLRDIAIARSGDKGNDSNVGIMAKTPELYQYLAEHLTSAVVKNFFHKICLGKVVRYELPKLQALNFILGSSLGGGGTEALITDAQGKVHGLGLLHMQMEVPDALLSVLQTP